ncbi:winged helix-turn-helix transcriptional regulator [Spirosoma jeollabukense]
MTSDRSDLPVVPDLNLINQSLAIVCGKWRLYIILLLGEQTLRYGKISEMLPGVSEKVLASELKTLVALGVMKRKAYAEIPPRVEYTLTKKGRLALPILLELQELGRIFN